MSSRFSPLLAICLIGCGSDQGAPAGDRDLRLHPIGLEGGASSPDSGAPRTEDSGTEDAGPPLAPRPDWNPAGSGSSVGWRNGTTPFCSSDVAYNTTTRLWSSSNAVYALVSASCRPPLEVVDYVCNIPVDSATQVVYENDGSGWKQFYRRKVSDTETPGTIAGFPDGRLVITSSSASGSDCPVTVVDKGGTASCIWTGSRIAPSAVAVAGTDTVLMLARDIDTGATTDLYEYSNATWTKAASYPWPTQTPLALVVQGTFALVAGLHQLAWIGDTTTGTFQSLPDVPNEDFWAGWAYAADDVFLSNGTGQLVHYDGATWTKTDTGIGSHVDKLWGAPDHTFYAVAGGSFVRLGATPTRLWPAEADAAVPDAFTDLWGNSSDEVFVSLNHLPYRANTCGSTFLLWSDGSSVHEF